MQRCDNEESLQPMRRADRTSGHVLEAYDLGYLMRSLCATGALNPVHNSVDNNHTRLPLCMFLISEANDDIDVGGLNASVKEPYSKDPYVVCVLGEVVAFELKSRACRGSHRSHSVP